MTDKGWLVAFNDIWPGNGMGLFCQLSSYMGAQAPELTKAFVGDTVTMRALNRTYVPHNNKTTW